MPERAASQQPPTADRTVRAVVPDRRADPPGRALWLEPYPDVLLDGLPDAGASPEARYRGQGGNHTGLRDRRPAPAAAAAGRASAQGRARVPRIRGGGHAGQQRGLGQQRTAAGQDHHGEPTAGTGAGSAASFGPEREVATRFATAFAANDIDAVVALLTDDAWFTMPPITLEYQGREAIAAFLRDIRAWQGPRRYRLVPTRANGQPAFGCYLQEGQLFRAHGMIVLTLDGDQISVVTRFVDNGNLARFGLPPMLAVNSLYGWLITVRTEGVVRSEMVTRRAAGVLVGGADPDGQHRAHVWSAGR